MTLCRPAPAVPDQPGAPETRWTSSGSGGDGAVGSDLVERRSRAGLGRPPAVRHRAPGAARADSALAGVGRRRYHLDVFWIGPDGAIASTWYDAAQGRAGGTTNRSRSARPPRPVAAGRLGVRRTTSMCSGRRRRLDRLDLVRLGAGDSWGDHQPFTIAGPASSVDLRGGADTGHLDVFWIGGDQHRSTWYDSATAALGRPPAVRGPPPGRVGRLPFGTSSGFAGPRSGPAGLFWTDPDARSPRPGGTPRPGWATASPHRRQVAATVGLGRPRTTWTCSGSAPTARSPRPGSTRRRAAAGATINRSRSPSRRGPGRFARIAAVGRTPNHLDVFWIGPDGAIASTWWDGAPGCGWGDHQPFTGQSAGSRRPGSGLTVGVAQPVPDRRVLGRPGRSRSARPGGTPPPGRAGATTNRSRSLRRAPPGRVRGSPRSAGRPNHLDVFWIGPDGAVGSTWWDSRRAATGRTTSRSRSRAPGAARPGSPLSAVGPDPRSRRRVLDRRRRRDRLDLVGQRAGLRLGRSPAVRDQRPGCGAAPGRRWPRWPGRRTTSTCSGPARADASTRTGGTARPGCSWGDHPPFTAAGRGRPLPGPGRAAALAWARSRRSTRSGRAEKSLARARARE